MAVNPLQISIDPELLNRRREIEECLAAGYGGEADALLGEIEELMDRQA